MDMLITKGIALVKIADTCGYIVSDALWRSCVNFDIVAEERGAEPLQPTAAVMQLNSKVRVSCECRALAESNAIHTVVGTIVLDPGSIGVIVRKGSIGWIVSFDLGHNIRLETDISKTNLEVVW